MEFEKNVTTEELRRLMMPTQKVPDGITFYKPGIPTLVTEYVELIETERTNRMCKCDWKIHPDDVEVLEGSCRVCHVVTDFHGETAPSDDHQFQGRRMLRLDDHPECPIHTKEGFILGFFEWAIEKGK